MSCTCLSPNNGFSIIYHGSHIFFVKEWNYHVLLATDLDFSNVLNKLFLKRISYFVEKINGLLKHGKLEW